MKFKKEISSHSSEQTRKIGWLLGQNAVAGDLVLLIGDLGAGKTTFTQGIAQGLQVDQPVRSPTFVLVTQYQGRLLLNHIDLYRIGGLGEVLDIGLEEYLLGDGISIIEWANRVPDAFPGNRLEIHFEYLNEKDRMLKFKCFGQRYYELLHSMI